MTIGELLPHTKFDLDRARAVVEAGYPAVDPILAELLEWTRDCNWPVAQVLLPFLAEIGEPLEPHIEKILQSSDDIWRYWVLVALVQKSAALARTLQPTLRRVADRPTAGESAEGVAEEAVAALRCLTSDGAAQPRDRSELVFRMNNPKPLVALAIMLATVGCFSVRPSARNIGINAAVRDLIAHSDDFDGRDVTVHGTWTIGPGFLSSLSEDLCDSERIEVVLEPSALRDSSAAKAISAIARRAKVSYVRGSSAVNLTVVNVDAVLTGRFLVPRCVRHESQEMLDLRQPCPDAVLFVTDVQLGGIRRRHCPVTNRAPD
jgi:hypothetical protein